MHKYPHTYPLRIPDELRAVAEEEAKKRRWSLNAYLRFAVESHVESLRQPDQAK